MKINKIPEDKSLLNKYSKKFLEDRYLLKNETPSDLFVRVAKNYSNDEHHAQRLYDYMEKLWFMPSTPILLNAGSKKNLPISCFVNEVSDDMRGIVDNWNENIWLSSRGGGLGTYYGNIRSIGEDVGQSKGKTAGVIPFLRVQDSITLAVSQGLLRRGSCAIYMPINHPEIEEFIEIRRPTGGDPNRKTLNLHHSVCITDDFMLAVEDNLNWYLISPKTKELVHTIKARELWVKILTARIETGEPYLLFTDTVNRNKPEIQQKLNLEIKTSNLCNEITLPTGPDFNNKIRTGVCCLSSVNLEKFDEWKDDELFIEDLMYFLDNVLQDFIDRAPPEMENAVYSAMRERSVGLGVMGFHSFLQKNLIPFGSLAAKLHNKIIFKHINNKTRLANEKISHERGPCLDGETSGINLRFSNTTAIAPTASISSIVGTSPSTEPINACAYNIKTLSGTYNMRNKYLEDILKEHNKNDHETWNSIFINNGSVQHLHFLTKDEKDVFKTAEEIDQRWIIEHAANRQPFITQSQSVNLFLPGNINKKDLHYIHFDAWKSGLKGLYYCRSSSVKNEEFEYKDECLSCQ